MNSLIGKHGVFRDGRNVGSVTVAEEGLMTVISCSCDLLGGGVLRLAAVSGDVFVAIGVVAPEAGRLRLKKSYTKASLTSLHLDGHTSFYLVLPDETFRGLKSPVEISGLTEAEPAAPEKADDGGQLRTAPIVKMTLGARDKPPEEDAEMKVRETPAPPEVVLEEKADVPEISPAAPAPKTEPGGKMPEIPGRAEADTAEIKQPKEKPGDGVDRDTGPWKPIRDPASLFSDGDIQQACKNARGALVTEREGFAMLAIPANADEPFPMMPIFCFGTSETIGGEEYIVFKTKNGNLAV